MQIKLIKLASELDSSISKIVKFLASNGREVIEDANTTLDDETADFVRDNLIKPVDKVSVSQSATPIADAKRALTPIYSRHDPIELKIVEAASGKAKFIERIIGYTEFKWQYLIHRFRGDCSKPVPFNTFDEVICGILLRRRVSFSELGQLLGLHVNEDNAERQILEEAITSLLNDKVIEEDKNAYILTAKGVEYVQKGAKVTLYERNFDIYVDSVAGVQRNAKNLFSNLRSEKLALNRSKECELTLEQVREYAVEQAPEVHYPENDFILQRCELRNTAIRQASVWVVLLENFRDKTLRTLVYDEESNRIVPELSDALDKKEDIKKQLLETMIVESQDHEFQMEFTTEEKSIEQLNDEKDLIAKQEAYDSAVEAKDNKLAAKIKSETLVSKSYFCSLEFEVELKRLFDTTEGEMWLISPWIKGATKRRIPTIIDYMKKGGRVFIAYSQPENEGDEMAKPDVLDELLELERKYTNFYLYQLPTFHYKRLFVYGDTQLYYSGSYNILSYFATPNKVRKEDMNKMIWTPETTELYLEVLVQFGRKYMDATKRMLMDTIAKTPDNVSLAKISMFESLKFEKLLPFVSKGSAEMDEEYKQLLAIQSDHVSMLRQRYITSQISSLKNSIDYLDNSPASINKRKEIRDALTELEHAFPDMIDSPDFIEIQSALKRSITIGHGVPKKFNKR